MNEQMKKIYNEIIKYVGDNCSYKDTDGIEKNFRKLTYEGYLGLSKNPSKKDIFNEKLKELFDAGKLNKMIKKFNKISTKGKIRNIDDFFKIGEKLFDRTRTSESSTIVRPVRERPRNYTVVRNNSYTRENINEKKSFFTKAKGFFKGAKEFIKEHPVLTGACVASLCLLPIPGLEPITYLLFSSPLIITGGIAAYKLYENRTLSKIFKRKNTKPYFPSDDADKDNEPSKGGETVSESLNRNNAHNNLKINRTLNKKYTSKKFNNESSTVGDPVLPTEKPLVPVFKENNASNSEETDKGSVDKLNDLLGNKQQTLLQSGEGINYNNKDSEVSKGKHLKKDNISELRNQIYCEINKYASLSKDENNNFYFKYGVGVSEYAKKYLRLLESAKTEEQLNEIKFNFNNGLELLLESEIKHFNREKEMAKKYIYENSTETQKKENNKNIKTAQNIINNSDEKINNIENEFVEIYKMKLEEIKSNNSDKYIQSCCDLVIKQLNLFAQDRTKSKYSIEDLKKQYNAIYYSVTKTEDLINQEVKNDERKK